MRKSNASAQIQNPRRTIGAAAAHGVRPRRSFDPEAIENSKRLHPQLEFSDDLSAVLDGADLVVLVTEWNEYRHLDPVWAGVLVGVRSVIDGRNCLDAKAWREAGWTYKGLGRP